MAKIISNKGTESTTIIMILGYSATGSRVYIFDSLTQAREKVAAFVEKHNLEGRHPEPTTMEEAAAILGYDASAGLVMTLAETLAYLEADGLPGLHHDGTQGHMPGAREQIEQALAVEYADPTEDAREGKG